MMPRCFRSGIAQSHHRCLLFALDLLLKFMSVLVDSEAGFASGWKETHSHGWLVLSLDATLDVERNVGHGRDDEGAGFPCDHSTNVIVVARGKTKGAELR